MNTKQKQESWEERLDKEFPIKDGLYNTESGWIIYSTDPKKLKQFIQAEINLALKEQRLEIVEKVLKIIDDNDPQTDNKVNPQYWGKTLRDDVSSLIKEPNNQL